MSARGPAAGPAAGLAAVAAVGVGLALLAACGDDTPAAPDRPAAETSRAAVQAATRSVAEVAAGAGLEVTDLTGRWTVCSVDPPLDKYAAGGSAVPTRGLAETVAAIARALERDGWSVESTTDGPRPSVTLSRGDLSAGVGAARHRPGEVDFGVRDRCVTSSPGSQVFGRETFAP